MSPFPDIKMHRNGEFPGKNDVGVRTLPCWPNFDNMSATCATKSYDTNWKGTCYLGLSLDWDYKECNFHLSMFNYIEKYLVRFGHKSPIKPQHQPHQHSTPMYGATIQFAKLMNTSSLLSKEDKRSSNRSLGCSFFMVLQWMQLF